MVDWECGYASRWSVRRVDPATWASGAALAGVDTVVVERSSGGLMEGGTVALSGPAASSFEPGWYRVEMSAEQGGSRALAPVATLLLSGGGRAWEGGAPSAELSGRSVLAPASQRVFRDGAYAPRGCDGAAWVAELLAADLDAPVRAGGSFRLRDHVVFDLGASHLEGARAVLAQAGWRLRISGAGEVSVEAPPAAPSATLDRSTAGLLLPSVRREAPAGDDVPNVLYVTAGKSSYEAVNDDPSSPTSVPSVGRRVEVLEADPPRAAGESLAAYARRRLAELGGRGATYAYRREWGWELRPGDLVHADLPEWGMSGTMRVVSQRVECGAGALVSETVEEV